MNELERRVRVCNDCIHYLPCSEWKNGKLNLANASACVYYAEPKCSEVYGEIKEEKNEQ